MTFVTHTLDSAPEASRRSMAATTAKFGYLPDAVAKLATSPLLLDGFLKLNAMFATTTLDPLAREVVVLTIATRNECHLCVAMHTATLVSLEAEAELIAALRDQRPLADARLAAIQAFTLAVLDTAGNVDDATLQDFLAHGYSPEQALEVVLGIGTYMMSTLANRLIRAEVDPALAPFAWPEHAVA